MTRATTWELTEQLGSPPAPSAVVGVVGAGHLARMLHQAAIPLDIEVRVLTADPDAPAVRAGARPAIGRAENPLDAAAFVDGCDVITAGPGLPAAVGAAAAAAGVPLRPSPTTLAQLADRGTTRRWLRQSGVPVPASIVAHSVEAALAFAAEHGWPVLLKPAEPRGEGRTWPVASRADLRQWWARHEAAGGVLVEQFLASPAELTVIVARRPSGERAVLPPVETVHRDGLCVEAFAPPRIDPRAVDEAVRLAESLADGLGVAGVLAVEFVITSELEVLVEDLSLQPHGSGQLTLDACPVSQFEQHLRAVLDWPLGDSRLLAPAAMVQVYGYRRRPRNPLPRALAAGPARVHLYGAVPRLGHELGHVTVLGATVHQALLDARAVAGRLVA